MAQQHMCTGLQCVRHAHTCMGHAPHSRSRCLFYFQAAKLPHRRFDAVLVSVTCGEFIVIPLQAPGSLTEALAILCIPNPDCCAEQALGVAFSTELQFGRCHAVQSSIDAVQHDSNVHDLQHDCNGHLHANVAEQPLNGVRRSEEVRVQDLLRAKKGKVCDNPIGHGLVLQEPQALAWRPTQSFT